MLGSSREARQAGKAHATRAAIAIAHVTGDKRDRICRLDAEQQRRKQTVQRDADAGALRATARTFEALSDSVHQLVPPLRAVFPRPVMIVALANRSWSGSRRASRGRLSRTRYPCPGLATRILERPTSST
jgi:hypothetical protein